MLGIIIRETVNILTVTILSYKTVAVKIFTFGDSWMVVIITTTLN